MKNKKHHNVGTVPKTNRKILESEAKWICLPHIYTTVHSYGLEQALQ